MERIIFESNLGAKVDTAIHPAASRGQVPKQVNL